MNKRTHVVIPEQLVKQIDMLVGSRQRSSFLTQAAQLAQTVSEIRQDAKDTLTNGDLLAAAGGTASTCFLPPTRTCAISRTSRAAA